MIETGIDLIKPRDIDPRQIGVRPDVGDKRHLPHFFENKIVKRLLKSLSKAQDSPLTEREISDLQRIDTEGLTIEKIERALDLDNQIKQWEEFSEGVTLSRSRSERRDRDYRLRSWFDGKDFLRLGKYFLEEAKSYYASAERLAKSEDLQLLKRMSSEERESLKVHQGAESLVPGLENADREFYNTAEAYLKGAALLAKEVTMGSF